MPLLHPLPLGKNEPIELCGGDDHDLIRVRALIAKLLVPRADADELNDRATVSHGLVALNGALTKPNLIGLDLFESEQAIKTEKKFLRYL